MTLVQAEEQQQATREGLEQQVVLRAWAAAPAERARTRCQQEQAEETAALRASAPAQAVAAEMQPRQVRQEEQAAH